MLFTKIYNSVFYVFSFLASGYVFLNILFIFVGKQTIYQNVTTLFLTYFAIIIFSSINCVLLRKFFNAFAK